MKGFSGFQSGKQRTTAIPNSFFSDLLPQIDHLAELKITLYAFWALTQQDRPVRYLRFTDFVQDTILMGGLGPTPTLAADALQEGVERAVTRGTLLHVAIESADGLSDLYFINSDRGRAAVDGIERGEWRPALGHDQPISLLIERPNVYVLYEQNIGTLTPMITDELRDAEQTYSIQWIEEAIQIAVNNNVRKWQYVRRILESWRVEGRDGGVTRQNSQTQRVNEIPDQYKALIER